MISFSRFINGQLVERRVDGTALKEAVFRVAAAAISGEKVRASAPEVARRLSICRACEFFQASPMRCLKCSCFLALKTRLETEHCPIGKW